jgi:hypothetical protein
MYYSLDGRASRSTDTSPTSPSRRSSLGDPWQGETADILPRLPQTAEKLPQIIDDLNSRHGSELGNSARVILEAAVGGMSDDEELVQEAKVNSKENFLLVFSSDRSRGRS